MRGVGGRAATLAAGVVAAVAGLAAPARALEVDEKFRTLEERPGGEITQLQFSADGEYICTGNAKGWVLSWDSHREQVGSARHLNTMVTAMAAYPKAPIMAHASEHGVRFTLIGGGGKVKLPSLEAKHKLTVVALDFSQDGDHMASADRGGDTLVWNLWNGRVERTLKAGKDPVNALRFAPDGKRLYAAGEDGKLLAWDVAGEKLAAEAEAHEGPVWGLAVSPDGKRLASSGKDRKIKLWSAADLKLEATLEGHEDGVNIVHFQPKGQPFLASASDDKTVRVWSLAEKKEVLKLAHDAPVYGLSWRLDGGALATGSGPMVRIYDVK